VNERTLSATALRWFICPYYNSARDSPLSLHATVGYQQHGGIEQRADAGAVEEVRRHGGGHENVEEVAEASAGTSCETGRTRKT